MQCQVRFNRVPKKAPEKVWEALVHSRSGATGFRRRFRGRFGRLVVQSQARFEKVPEKVPSRETLVQNQVKFNRVPEKVCRALVQRSSAWLRSTLHKNVQKKCCSCCGYHRTLFWYRTVFVLQ